MSIFPALGDLAFWLKGGYSTLKSILNFRFKIKNMSSTLLKHFQSRHLSVSERMEAGKALRDKFHRNQAGDYKPAHNRPDPVSILEEQAKTRLEELVPIRYARMLTSPFAFLRGSAAIMAADLAAGTETTGITVQVCGDMHVANFGLFASAERNLVFGINDFDETIPGPWEWDLKRLAVSIVASGRFLGAKESLCEKSVLAAIKSYRKRMHQYAVMGNLELWYTTIKGKDLFELMTPAQQKRTIQIMEKARTRTHMQVLEKLTDIIDEKYMLRENAPFIVRQTHTKFGRTINEAMELFLESYFHSLGNDRKKLLYNYRVVDVVRKIVGVGSVGTRCWVLLMMGNHSNDPLFLQIKEAQPSVLEAYTAKSVFSNQGRRVVEGQRLIQGAPDIFLGWGEQDGIDFYVRQLRDMKGGKEFDIDNKNEPVENMPLYATACAWALALAHAKSGDPAIIAGYVGNSDALDKAITRFAFAYADQNEKDFKALTAAAKSKRIITAGRAS
jgi:uncharacterized protein (DUF2252 family)